MDRAGHCKYIKGKFFSVYEVLYSNVQLQGLYVSVFFLVSKSLNAGWVGG